MNFSQMIGKVRVTRIQEMTSAGFTFELMYPLYDKAVIEANRSWMVPNYMTPDTEQMLQSQNSWIVETPETTIFVDPANGNGKVRRIPRFNNLQTPYLDKIRRAGIDLEKVDVVLCTHFHSDHYGWWTASTCPHSPMRVTFTPRRTLSGPTIWTRPRRAFMWTADAGSSAARACCPAFRRGRRRR